MKSLSSLIALVAVFGSVAASAAEKDPLTEYLVTVKHFSNVPYTDQVRVAAGGYVAYDTEHKKFPPAWEGPVEGETPVIMQGVDDIPIPSETLSKLRSLNLDVKIFGINPMAKLSSTGHVEYSEMILKPSALRDTNAVYALLTPGSALDKEFREYGGNGSAVYSNQHLYAILTVYYSTGVTITSDKSLGFGGSTGETIATCPTSITPATPAVKPAEGEPAAGGGAAQAPAQNATGTPTVPAAGGAPKGADPKAKETLSSIAAVSAKAALIAAGQAAGGKTGEAVAGSGGAVAAKSTGNQAAADAVKAASGALPGGGGSYCRVDETHVEFHSARPVPIAAQLLRVFPLNDGKWNLLPAIVKFDGEKTTEISH